jgi:hypothetical protein
MENEKSKGKSNWKDDIDNSKPGADYFLAFNGRPEFNPDHYISVRGLALHDAQRLLPKEWASWIQHFKDSTCEHAKRRARSAPLLFADQILKHYKNRVVDTHEFEVTQESSSQIVNTGRALGNQLRNRQSMCL